MAHNSLRRALDDVVIVLALGIWVVGLLAGVVWAALTLVLLPLFPIPATASAAVLVALLLIPLNDTPPALARRFLSFSLQAAYKYYPVSVIFEDRAALDSGHPFVVGYEPHGVLPQGMSAFSRFPAEPLPRGLANSRICASSALFLAPVIRHLAWWLGVQPASRHDVSAALKGGSTVLLCPGGVQECLFMQQGEEHVYLRKRHGFARLALQHGAPLVPVFAFGQTPVYWFKRPFLDFWKGWIPAATWSRIARRVGFLPMLVWGPWRIPLIIVVGKPIPVVRVADPSAEQVQQLLGAFISEMGALFERNKAAAGYPATQLIVH